MSLLERLEPGARAYMERLIREGGKPLPELAVEEARQFMRDGQATPLEHPSVSIRSVEADGVPLTIVAPVEVDGALPAVLYLHGGGWVLGGIETHARIVREIALGSQAAVVFPHYTLAPEVRFPVAVEQCYRAAQWIETHGAEHEIDISRMAVAGDSAGGNLAAVVAQLAAERSGPKFRVQALMCPVTQAPAETASYDEFAEGLNLTRDAMDWFWGMYVPDRAMWRDPAAAPLHASLDVLRRVPPAVIVTAECDVLRDDGELYARRLFDAGVPATATRLMGTLHNFTVIDDLCKSGPAVCAMQIVNHALRTALHA